METLIGHVTHYYNHLGVAVLELTEGLTIGDHVHFHDHARDFTQSVASMEVDHRPMQSVGPGANVAVKVVQPVRDGDDVYHVIEDVREAYL